MAPWKVFPLISYDFFDDLEKKKKNYTMSCYVIYYKDGAKWMRPVRSEAEYRALRDSAKQRAVVEKVRMGEPSPQPSLRTPSLPRTAGAEYIKGEGVDTTSKLKSRLLQMNYSCLPNDDGSLKGSTRASNSVGMDVDILRNENESENEYQARLAEIPQKVLAKKEELGLLMLERSATKGYHLVFRRRPELSQEENLRWASDLLGVEFDKGAKDITRVFFTTTGSEEDLLFLDEELFKEPSPGPSPRLKPRLLAEGLSSLPSAARTRQGRGIECDEDAKEPLQRCSVATNLAQTSATEGAATQTATLAATAGKTSGTGAMEVTSEVTTPLPRREGPGEGSGSYPLSDIAASWILYQGEPRQGERHTFYYQMASYFRYITDNDARLIFDHLPDFGLGAEERWKICDHVVKLSNGGRIPYDFYRFLVDHGYKERPGQQRRDDADPEVDEAAAAPAPAPELPVLPPLVRDLVGVAPVDFKVPTVFALFPILATHCTRIRARYYDGAEHSPSCASVIIAPQGSGKSFVHRFDPLLVHKFEEHDDAEIERLNAYLAEKEEHRNDKKQPKEVRVPLRLLPAKISVSQFLDRQLDAHGLHQLTICDELDTFTKSNDGGSWADKSDVYRVAYDNGTYGQDYKNQTIYKGRVRLHYNWLVTGTPKSVGRFFRDVEDGLVSRVAFCRIENQLFSDFSIWEPLSRKQQTQIHRIVDRLDALTYDEEGNVRPTKMVDMSWLFEPLHQWLLGKLHVARKGWNVAMDTFRRRAAVNAFRYALICTQLYGRLDASIRQEITEFALWFAEQDLQNRLDLFQQRLNDEAPTSGGNVTQQQTLFDLLPEKFGKEDVRNLCRSLGIKSEPRYIICIWKKNGDILKLGSGQWMKVA